MNARTADQRPLLLHLTSYAFTPRSHPGIFRSVVGLTPRYRSAILSSDRAPYHAEPLSEAEQAELAAAGITVHPIEFTKLRKPGQIEYLAAGVRARHGAPTAFFAHLGNNGWRALPLARALDVPVVTVFHGNDASVDLRDEEYAWRYARLREAPAALHLGVSGNIVERLVEFGMPPERCRVAHLGVDLDRYPVPDRSGEPERALDLVLAGRFLDFKGHAVALEALARIAREVPDVTLHLYGEGPLEEALRKQTEALGVTPRVRFHGIVPVEELRRAFARAHVALQPSLTASDGRSEGVPNTVLEALAVELPVVGTRHAGIPEAVLDGETGLLVDEHDAAGLAEAVLRLARDSGLRRRLGRAGRLHVEREFDALRQGERLADEIDGLRGDYAALGRTERRAAWQRALVDLIEPPAEYGLRYRSSWAWKALRNRFEGRIG